MRSIPKTPRVSSATALKPSIRRELEEIDSFLASLDHYLSKASHLAELGSLAPLFAHEVNNLMTQVGGRAQLALMHPDEPEIVGKALRLAARASAHISELATIFLDSSEFKHANGQNHLVRDIHAQALGFVSEHDLTDFKLALIESEPGIGVDVLPVLLQQVLLNLYLNAARALRQSSKDNATIITRAELIEQADVCSTGNTRRVRITVEDNASGMTPTQIEQALSGRRVEREGSTPPPSQPNKADQLIHPNAHARQTQSGHGLGLAVCRKLLTEAGGSLSCHSTPGVGTRMIITLPAATRAQDMGVAA